MTEATGSQNQSPQPSKAPWEQAWNDVKDGLSVIGESMSDTFVPKTPPGMPSPWERMWGADKPKEKPAVAAPKQAATTDGSWDEINKKYAQGQGERDKAQLTILQDELANAKDPKHKAILQREIARVGGNVQTSGAYRSELEIDRKEYEALPTFTGNEILSSGMDTKEGRNVWYSKMLKEWEAGKKGMNRAQLDKYYSNPSFYAMKKYPKEFAIFNKLDRMQVDGFNDEMKSVLGKNHKYSFVDTMAPGSAAGWVYTDGDNRAFLAAAASVKDMAHETEHIEQKIDSDKNGRNSTAYQSGKIGAYGSPINKFVQWTAENKDDPAVKEVFNATNAHDNTNEWLANLSAHWKTSIPQGKSWSDTPLYKKMVAKFGKDEAHTMMIDALLTINRSAEYARNR